MPEQYEVQQGDCITSIAFEKGLYWETLWNHADNASLKEKRKDPNVLLAGDIVVIPDQQLKEVTAACEQKHRFKLKGVPAKIKLQMLVDNQPRKNEPYRINIDGEWRTGKTDGQGFIKQSIPNGLQSAILVIGPPDSEETINLKFGTVDPLDTDGGVCSRLHDLGFNPNPDDLSGSVSAFQDSAGLQANGTLDDATRAKLKEVFGL
jgi:hypothetical protein